MGTRGVEAMQGPFPPLVSVALPAPGCLRVPSLHLNCAGEFSYLRGHPPPGAQSSPPPAGPRPLQPWPRRRCSPQGTVGTKGQGSSSPGA